jgi:hypothetical protein
VSGSGDLIVETKVNTAALSLNVSGSGSLKIDAQADDVSANVSGSGDMELRGKYKSFTSDISGSGEIAIDAAIAGETEFEISGSGKVMAKGTAQSVKARISGSGKVMAADLVADTCDVRISGSGGVEINVKSELNARISGSGSVYYKGEPKRVNADSSKQYRSYGINPEDELDLVLILLLQPAERIDSGDIDKGVYLRSLSLRYDLIAIGALGDIRRNRLYFDMLAT